MSWLKRISLSTWKIILITGLLVPLAVLTWKLFNADLGAQPAEELNHAFGELTFRLLAINLIWGGLLSLNWVPSSLRRLTFLRRHLGIMTFVYALLHVTFYFIREGDFAVGFSQLLEKTYLWFGFGAFTILAALTFTSNNWSVRRLRHNWKKLHRLAYVAIALATVHFVLIEKKDWRVILPFIIPLVLLYILRAYRALRTRP